MKKLLLLSCLFVFLVGCENKPGCEDSSAQKEAATAAEGCPLPDPGPQPEPIPLPSEPDPIPGPIPDPEIPSEEVPHEALIFDAKVKLISFDSEDEAKVEKAIEIIKRVVGTKEFKDKVFNFTYKGKKQFIDNRGLTNEQIYQILLDGREELRPELDHEMDLELELYYSWRSTVGYTYPDGLRIWMNRKFFDYYTPSEVAGNVFHEWTHKLGFDHASSYSESRDYSVPYGLGYLMEELGKKYE